MDQGTGGIQLEDLSPPTKTDAAAHLNDPHEQGSGPRPPELVFIRLREQCNARCQMCSFWELPSGAGLSPDQVFAIVRELCEAGVKEVAFTGGEPFYYPGLDTLLNRMAELAAFPDLSVITNGSRRDAFARRVLSYPGLVRVHVSLDDVTDEGMLVIRGHQGWYRGVMEFVQIVRDVAPGAQVVANVIVNRHNWERLERYFDHDFDSVNFLLLKTDKALEMALDDDRAGAMAVRLARLFSSDPGRTGRAYIPFNARIDGDMGGFEEYLWGREAWAVPCVLTQRLAYIDQYGEIYPCNCRAHDRSHHSLGNVLREGFLAVWNGTGRSFREHCSHSEDWRTCAGCDPANRLYNIGAALRAGRESLADVIPQAFGV